MNAAPSIQSRIAEVKRRLRIDTVVERHVKLSGSAQSKNRRGQCPFHGSNSASLSVKIGGTDSGDGFAHCFGCQWHGDVIRFVQDFFGLPFSEALARCESEAGIGGDAVIEGEAAPVRRERNPAPRRYAGRSVVDPIDMGRWIWKRARREDAPVRRYFEGRGVPARVLTEDRLGAFRYLSECPVAPWRDGEDPLKGPVAPAIVADVVRPTRGDDGVLTWRVTGVHVTYLAPDGISTMVRRKPWAKPDDTDPMLPKRRMLGPVGGGAVIIGHYDRDARLYVGEGNETVLSGMAIAGADAGAVGVATLSLDNLQGGLLFGRSRRDGERFWPLHAIAPDADRPCFTIPGHHGPVTGLIDSDMAPLRGRKDPQTGAFRGELVQPSRRGGFVRRAISGAERSQVCGELFVRGWRASGAAPVEAMRAPPGMDFNDAARAAMEGV